jgi:hypothetical protein
MHAHGVCTVMYCHVVHGTYIALQKVHKLKVSNVAVPTGSGYVDLPVVRSWPVDLDPWEVEGKASACR